MATKVQRSGVTGKPWMIPDSLSVVSTTLTAIMGGKTYSVTLTALVSNTLYYLYFVPGVGLVYHSSPPSIGPGVSQYVLIGAFYSNNMTTPGFGAFVKIDNKPESDWWATNTAVGAAIRGTSNPSYGNVVANIYRLRRDGKKVLGEWSFRQQGAGGTGTGAYIVLYPFAPDFPQYKTLAAQTWTGQVGTLMQNEETSGVYKALNFLYMPGNVTDGMGGQITAHNGTSLLFGDWGASIFHFGVATISFFAKYDYLVSGWSDTPLKDA